MSSTLGIWMYKPHFAYDATAHKNNNFSIYTTSFAVREHISNAYYEEVTKDMLCQACLC